jgi:hypothetical protein
MGIEDFVFNVFSVIFVNLNDDETSFLVIISHYCNVISINDCVTIESHCQIISKIETGRYDIIFNIYTFISCTRGFFGLRYEGYFFIKVSFREFLPSSSGFIESYIHFSITAIFRSYYQNCIRFVCFKFKVKCENCSRFPVSSPP